MLRSLFLPSSIVAGTLALLLGPQALGAVVRRVAGEGHGLADGVFAEGVMDVWQALPGLLISVVFAALFLGKQIPGPRRIWREAGPQVVFGQTLAWGQYVIGLVLALAVLTPLFGLSPMAGALIEIGFEGGHGTAAGLAGTFADLGFEEGADLALGLATVGVVMGVVLGTVLVNWAARTGRVDIEAGEGIDRDEAEILAEFDEREVRSGESRDETIDPLSVHIGFIALAVGLGWLLREALVALEAATWGGEGGLELLAHVPLFPLAMIGGVLVQLGLDRVGRPDLIDRRLMNRLSGAALDLIIVAALATLSLEALGDNVAPFAVLALAGMAWNVAAFVFIAPRVIPRDWVPRGMGDFGQSMGMTVTGLLLMRIADPRNRSGALEAFGYKQLLFEPVVGGGLFTAASLPLIAQLGAGWTLVICSVVLVFWIVLGWRTFVPEARAARAAGT